ncbi:sulfatase-like hydrolase/transferase [Verrucomicrobiaceae bacterium N1E253]|uniref:Sulfatase-like hydrolase/transferase n=1 Tax=Oceaniferula marina TaxID=2748318 RepID=A0A851GAV8_9BACT|nr:sulfatase-like hydrolase/transferase [Oceaniferula marina]NWK54546.1 sulfatase-like hydrolase/transferase [Oceaniferula marina]
MKYYTLIPLLMVVFMQCSVAKTQYNILFILSDNQSYYEMACHGHSELKTPSLDRLAAQSVDFQNCYAPNYCSPSRSVIMTGKYAIRTGVYDTIGGRSIMHKDHETIADIMKRNGYKTSVYGKWHLGFSYPHRPQDRGFEETYVLGGGSIGQLEDYYGNNHHDPVFVHNGKKVFSKGYSTDVLFDNAMKWMEGLEGKPFFCFLSTPAVHGPFESPDGKRGMAALHPMIENLDMNVGRMMKKLDEMGIADKTVVIFASDQGMFDRGAPHLTDRKENSLDAKQHIPFMVRLPGAKAKINQNITGIIDFVPTVLDLCGIERPDGLDGVSLKPLLTGKEDEYPADRTLIIQCPRQRGVRKGVNSSVKTARWRLDGRKLFDKKNDPRLRNDVASQHPEVVQMLSAKYEEYWKSMPDPATTLSRNEIGAPECPDTSLTAMDWYTGAKPWSSGHIKKGRADKLNGAWAVKVVRDGTYTFELCHFPQEANKALNVTSAKIKIGEVEKEQKVEKTAKSAKFTLKLKAGDYDLQTWLSDGPNKDFGALYVYVTKDK